MANWSKQTSTSSFTIAWLQTLKSRRASSSLSAQLNEQPSLNFSVTEETAGERLDVFLAKQLDGWSRSRLQRLIEEQDVLVNGRAAKPSYKLRPNDQVDAEFTALPPTKFQPEDIPVDVIYEDDDLIVVNKPAAMVVHPASGIRSGTLANALAFHFQKLSSGGGESRPGI